MRRVILLAVGACSLAACAPDKAAGPGEPATLRLKPADGTWSARQALEGPMAVWGPAGPETGMGREVLSVTCLPRPRRELLVTLFAPASKTGKLGPGELMLRVDGKGVGVPLTLKEDGSADARLPASDATIAAWESARDLRFELRAAPGDGVDSGPAAEPLKRILAACR